MKNNKKSVITILTYLKTFYVGILFKQISTSCQIWITLIKISLICNGNRTEWSPVRSIIKRVIYLLFWPKVTNLVVHERTWPTIYKEKTSISNVHLAIAIRHLHLFSSKRACELQKKILVGQLYLLLYLFYRTELFPDYRTQRPSLP